MAEMEGFEPPMTLRPYWFSRPARSTTPAHLLKKLKSKCQMSKLRNFNITDFSFEILVLNFY